MTAFRVGFFPDFHYGDAVVLVDADHDGMRVFQSAVRSAQKNGEGTFEVDTIQHHVQRRDGGSDIEGLTTQKITWIFDEERLVEILNLIEPLVISGTSGHQYLDYVNSPVATVIFSVDEYVDGGPFVEFPQGLPVPPPIS